MARCYLYLSISLQSALLRYLKYWLGLVYPAFLNLQLDRQAGLDEYKAAEYSRKYLAEHEADLALYRAPQETFRRLLDGSKLPKMEALKAEIQGLAAKKKAAYGKYRAARKEMQELITAKTNVDVLLGLADTPKNKEMER